VKTCRKPDRRRRSRGTGGSLRKVLGRELGWQKRDSLVEGTLGSWNCARGWAWGSGLWPSGVASGCRRQARVATKGTRESVHLARVRPTRPAGALPGTPGIPKGSVERLRLVVGTPNHDHPGLVTPARASQRRRVEATWRAGHPTCRKRGGGAVVGGARAPELGSGVSCRVHVTTSRLQMVGKRHLAR
jgi:hypothetical protein